MCRRFQANRSKQQRKGNGYRNDQGPAPKRARLTRKEEKAKLLKWRNLGWLGKDKQS
jgi:hypothetical protein